MNPPTAPAAQATATHDPFAALRSRNFRFYLPGNLLSVLGTQMQTVAVLWEVYERTKPDAALYLGMVGLVQVVPIISLALVAGHVADRFDRRRVLTRALGTMALASIGLCATSLLKGPIELLYVCLFLNGVARAFQQPTKSSFLPQIVPRESFPNAITWSMTGFQLASVLGPAVGGILIAVTRTPAVNYALDAVAAVLFVVLLTQVQPTRLTLASEPVTLRSVAAGLNFVCRSPIILTIISIDLFAVLLGGATALLPIYAETILHVGPAGLGQLQSAAAIGGLTMSVLLALRPPMARAGLALLWAVAGFGVATIVFGLSRSFYLSLVMLALTGAFDMVSVVVRHTLVQLLTPDAMRGRVSAINGMFISASNELGEFESGVVAKLFGPVVSVVAGGIGTLLVVLVAAWLSPELRRFGRLDDSTKKH